MILLQIWHFMGSNQSTPLGTSDASNQKYSPVLNNMFQDLCRQSKESREEQQKNPHQVGIYDLGRKAERFAFVQSRKETERRHKSSNMQDAVTNMTVINCSSCPARLEEQFRLPCGKRFVSYQDKITNKNSHTLEQLTEAGHGIIITGVHYGKVRQITVRNSPWLGHKTERWTGRLSSLPFLHFYDLLGNMQFLAQATLFRGLTNHTD